MMELILQLAGYKFVDAHIKHYQFIYINFIKTSLK